jgi:hypothetical protein
MENVLLRPRSATEIVDASFRLCRAHYGVLVTVVAILAGPAILLKVVLPPELAGLASVLERLLFIVGDGAAIAIASEAHLGRSVDLATGLRAVRGRAGSLVVSYFARNLLVAIGLLLLIVPGVFLFIATFAVPMAIVLEGMRIGPAFTRAQKLVEEHIAHVLGTLALLVVIVGALFVGLILALEVLREMTGLEERTTDLLQDVGLILLFPLYNVGSTLLYYDLRIRREGFDLEQMAHGLSGGAQSAGSPAPAPPLA